MIVLPRIPDGRVGVQEPLSVVPSKLVFVKPGSGNDVTKKRGWSELMGRFHPLH